MQFRLKLNLSRVAQSLGNESRISIRPLDAGFEVRSGPAGSGECSAKAVVLSHRGMHIPGAAQPGVKHHQVSGTKAHRLTAIGGDRHVALQQQTGLLLVVGPGEAADPTAPGGPARHPQALQLRWIRIGGDCDLGGHGCLLENQGPLSDPRLPQP